MLLRETFVLCVVTADFRGSHPGAERSLVGRGDSFCVVCVKYLMFQQAAPGRSWQSLNLWLFCASVSQHCREGGTADTGKA